MKLKTRVLFLVKFPASYRYNHYFEEEDRARRFVRNALDTYGIRGKVIKVKECK